MKEPLVRLVVIVLAVGVIGLASGMIVLTASTAAVVLVIGAVPREVLAHMLQRLAAISQLVSQVASAGANSLQVEEDQPPVTTCLPEPRRPRVVEARRPMRFSAPAM